MQYNIILKWSEIYGKSSFFEYFYLWFPMAMGGSLPLYAYGVKEILS
jgi:hypothetical protein